MDMEHETPKKLGVLAAHGDGEPPKTLDARYVKEIMHYFDNPEKATHNMMMGVTLDQREYFRHYRLTQKGKLLWDQIYMLRWYAWDLCKRYDFTCCSRMDAPHLPFSCKFNDHETLASYANGIYDYYGVEQIEEFVAFNCVLMKLNLCLKSMKIVMMLFTDLKIFLYLNIAMRIMNIMPILMNLLRKSPLSKKRLLFCRNLWKKKLMTLC